MRGSLPPTAIGHRWLVRSTVGARKDLRTVVIDDEEQKVIIEKKAPREATPSTNAPEPEPVAPTAVEKPPVELPRTLSNAAMKPARAIAEKESLACGKANGSLFSSVRINFGVGPSGKVDEAKALPPMNPNKKHTVEVVVPPMNGKPVGVCVAKAVSSLEFPKSQVGVDSMTWELPLLEP